MFDEALFPELVGFNAPLTDEDFARFGPEVFSQGQIDQGNFSPEDLNLEEAFGEPDV